eukprot:CAMPEP_0117662894 /NCGR_PEP_ID=MMETSP0804-20121206/8294_1 /TAXON_ID=1074897 /ORGANISM="Tetraselmis astigmatica, Strain CCMP880" /LENGTH=350 /DNA_ID=CAMNT_0005469819 /DNA_START=804 /DNA_END=1853 /DNA_ORIENTATION=+
MAVDKLMAADLGVEEQYGGELHGSLCATFGVKGVCRDKDLLERGQGSCEHADSHAVGEDVDVGDAGLSQGDEEGLQVLRGLLGLGTVCLGSGKAHQVSARPAVDEGLQVGREVAESQQLRKDLGVADCGGVEAREEHDGLIVVGVGALVPSRDAQPGLNHQVGHRHGVVVIVRGEGRWHLCDAEVLANTTVCRVLVLDRAVHIALGKHQGEVGNVCLAPLEPSPVVVAQIYHNRAWTFAFNDGMAGDQKPTEEVRLDYDRPQRPRLRHGQHDIEGFPDVCREGSGGLHGVELPGLWVLPEEYARRAALHLDDSTSDWPVLNLSRNIRDAIRAVPEVWDEQSFEACARARL